MAANLMPGAGVIGTSGERSCDLIRLDRDPIR